MSKGDSYRFLGTNNKLWIWQVISKKCTDQMTGKEKTNASLESRVDDPEHCTRVNVITSSRLETRPQYDSDSDGRWVAHQAKNKVHRATDGCFLLESKHFHLRKRRTLLFRESTENHVYLDSYL